MDGQRPTRASDLHRKRVGGRRHARTVEKIYSVARASLTWWLKHTLASYDRSVTRARRIVSVPVMVALTVLVAAGCGGAWRRESPPERALDHILPSSVQIVLEQ